MCGWSGAGGLVGDRPGGHGISYWNDLTFILLIELLEVVKLHLLKCSYVNVLRTSWWSPCYWSAVPGGD